jgi:vacuolar-type H+-ATPase catalytic subunit A/Vma1
MSARARPARGSANECARWGGPLEVEFGRALLVSDKTVLQQALAKWADPGAVVYLGRARAVTSSPRRCRRSRRSSTRAPGPSLTERTILANTSNMLFAGPRGVDPYPAITLAEY